MANDKTKFTIHVFWPSLPLFLIFRYIPQGLLVAKEKYLLVIQLKSKNKNYSCLPQKCPPTVHLWVFKVKDFRNVKNNWQFYIHNAFLPRHIYSLYSVWYLKKVLRYKTGDLNTKSLFEANVVLSAARILYCLFVTYASLILICLLASPAYREFGIWGEVLVQTLSTAPFVFIAQIVFFLDYSTDIFAWLHVLLSTPQAMAACLFMLSA